MQVVTYRRFKSPAHGAKAASRAAGLGSDTLTLGGYSSLWPRHFARTWTAIYSSRKDAVLVRRASHRCRRGL